jgi:hypothetical protein
VRTAVAAHDQGFVPAPPQTVYEVLADVGGYGGWWAGTAVDAEGRPRFAGGPAVAVSAERHRPGVGLFLRLGPPLDGTLEWYLEPFEEGTVVNSILDVHLAAGGRRLQRRLHRLRSGIRAGLVDLQGRVA